MAKIGSTRIAMPSLNFGDSNRLMNDGLATLLDAFKPVQTQMDANFAERESNATGSLLEQISQGMPQDYNNNPEARAAFDNQISQFATNNNLAREGVNKQDLFTTLNAASVANDTNRGNVLANQAKQLANTEIQDQQIYDQAFNNYASRKISKEDFEAITNGLVVNRQNNQNKTVIDNQAIANGNFTPQLALAQYFQDGKMTPTIEKLLSGLDKTIYQNEAKTTGKGQAPSYQGGRSSTSLNDGAVDLGSASRNIQSSLIGTESSGNPAAVFTSGKSGNSYGGLMQFGTARLKDYANSTGNKAMTALQFKNLPASEQQKVNDWHTEDLIKKAEATGAIGKTINGVPVTLGGLVAVAHIGGYGGMQKFVKTNGKYNPQDDLGTSLTDYLGKHAGSESGGGNSEYEQLFQQATQSSMRPEDLDALRELSEQVGTREGDTFDKLYLGMENAAPDPVNPELFSDYQSPEMLSQRNQGLMDTLTGIEDGNIDTVNQLSQMVSDFDATVSDRSQTIEDAQDRLAADMAANGGDIVEVSNYVKKQGMFKKWLFESAITPEMFNSYPTDIQGALIKQQMTREQNFGKKDRKANNYIAEAEKNLLSTDKEDSYTKASKNILAQRAEERKIKEVENIDVGFFGGKNDAYKYLDKRANFETGIAIYIDKELEDNPETYFRNKEGKAYSIGTNDFNVNRLIDIITEEYDKIVSTADKPKIEYLSKNLEGKGMYLSGEAIKEAVINGMLRHTEAMNNEIKKNTPKESSDQDLTASDVIANIALTGNLK